MIDIHVLLKELDACYEAQKWASKRTWEQIYNECHRGDWLCWLFACTNPDDVQLLTLVKGHQANTVRHLMTYQRSLDAVDAAIAFGEGRISLEELNEKANAANYTATNAADYADYAAYAANAAAYADSADYAANAAAYAAYAANASANAAAGAQNRQETADIFRKFIKITDFNL